MLKRPMTWLFVALAGLVALTYFIGRTHVTPRHSLKTGVETPSAKSKEGNPEQRPAATESKDQPPSTKYEKDCPDPQKRGECIIQVRTAEATEAQARYTKWSLYLVGVTIVLTFGTVFAGFLTLGTMRDTARKQLRAYVVVRPTRVEFRAGIPVMLHADMTNAGQTPAYKVVSFNTFQFCPTSAPVRQN